MKRQDISLFRMQRRTIQAGALFAALAIASLPGQALADTTAGAAAPAVNTAPAKADGKTTETGGVEALIKHLHGELKITSAQEDLWQNVASVMRDNAETMSKLAKSRADNAKTMTAVDDLKSYSEISEAHAEGTKKMIPVFQALYDSMSEGQKKAADTEFREHYNEHHHHTH